jgi:hypothetical protein
VAVFSGRVSVFFPRRGFSMDSKGLKGSCAPSPKNQEVNHKDRNPQRNFAGPRSPRAQATTPRRLSRKSARKAHGRGRKTADHGLGKRGRRGTAAIELASGVEPGASSRKKSLSFSGAWPIREEGGASLQADCLNPFAWWPPSWPGAGASPGGRDAKIDSSLLKGLSVPP